MNKPESLLTDTEMHALISGNRFTLGLSIARLKDFIRQVEKAVAAKLHEQEPVAVVASDFQLMYRGGAAISEIEGLKVGMVLYAHPMPSPSDLSDKTACVSENGKSDMQLARQQPCGCVVCYCENQERCLGCGAKYCGTHEVGEMPNPVYADHIPFPTSGK